MAPKPETSREIAAALIAAYVLAEQNLLHGASQILRHTIRTEGEPYTVLTPLRRLVRRVLAMLEVHDAQAGALVSAAVLEGRRYAQTAVRTVLDRYTPTDGQGGGAGRPPGRSLDRGGDGPFDLSLPHGERAAEAIRADIVSAVTDVRTRITRLPDDIYKMIAPHGSIYQVIDQGVSPAQAQAMAWRVFVSQGVTGFTDRSGREWSLSAYVEMAVRTAAARAYNDSHLQRMQALGVEYFSVPDTGHPCPKCFPWQGRVLVTTPKVNPPIHVDATIEEAIAAGLFHPNCRHTLIPVMPGFTELPETREWTPEDQRLYDLSQKQRRLELDIRKAKRQVEYAATPEARHDAQVRVARAQAKVRAFVRDTGFLRDSRREQLDLSDARIKLPTPIR